MIFGLVAAFHVKAENSQQLLQSKFGLLDNYHPPMPDPVPLIIQFAKTNNIPDELIVAEVMSTANQLKDKIEKNEKQSNLILKFNLMLRFLVRLDNKDALPFLETATCSSNQWIKINATLSYIKIAKGSALDSIQKIMTKNNFNGRNREKIYDELLRHVNSNEEKDKFSIFLLEQAENENDDETICTIDSILASNLPSYTSSIQRSSLYRRVQISGSVFSKNYFAKVKQEIDRVPCVSRKDFRAKGELLDPERKKNKTDVQP